MRVYGGREALPGDMQDLYDIRKGVSGKCLETLFIHKNT